MLTRRLSLGTLPTPVEPLQRLSEQLNGPPLWIKRDDLTGLALGGNKTRKLEYILCDAMDIKADCIITAGAIQSNHCRQTAAAAAKLGLECHLVLGGQAPEHCNGNLLLDQLFNARVHWAGEKRKGEDIPELVKQLKAQGKTPFVVPYGGSNVSGALGYVNAMSELQQQCTEPFSHIVFASASGGTHAGMLNGAKLCNMQTQIWGIRIDKSESEGQSFAQRVLELTNDTAKHLGLSSFATEAVHLNADYLGGGYAVVGEAERHAIKTLAQVEGILLDPVYTGRAFAGLLDLYRQGAFAADDKVLFWHTGGSPALFAYNDSLV
ncbi:D-cysteine desulfhydrase family protein [Lacimicrobium sp. SS2-24]|uniref:D-cysteine desulfhydrase family protein n=1 Tax=Lacimicrobium sp. SS2-24 TaxID=2005569 RepID=UPI000B4AA942|nr:D-cysteine desulfhydrase family protein [Lacimicrobium sp. SS2-24]